MYVRNTTKGVIALGKVSYHFPAHLEHTRRFQKRRINCTIDIEKGAATLSLHAQQIGILQDLHAHAMPPWRISIMDAIYGCTYFK